jgi:signal transduction histidine kinase
MVGAVEDGFLVQAWATQVDVTPRFQAEQEREELEQRLRRSQRLETIGTLAGGIAHDFNNILAPILGFADLAEDSVEPGDRETRASIGQIKTAANRAKELVSQILAVGQQRDNIRKPVHLSDVVADALDLLNQSLPATISLETSYQRDCPPALADPAQLHQVVMNLCTNSAQAMPDSDGTIRLEVTCEVIEAPPDGWESRPGRYVVLSVTDDGQGMSEETLSRAVEPFYTTKEAGRGSGLGLSVTHGIVHGHGGHLELESEERVGTKVTVYLPAANGTLDAPEESVGEAVLTSDAASAPQQMGTKSLEVPNTPPDESERDPGGDPPRVMLVDDEVGVVQTCEAMLRRLGYRVDAFTDSVAAKDALASEAASFDLLLTDHTMPEITGPELAALALEENPSIAVVIASGHRFGDDSSPDGQVVRLEKPFTVAELKASVEKVLGTG